MKQILAGSLLLTVLLPGALAAQRIGILPFEDASGIGGKFGEQVAKYVRSELLKEKRLIPKFIKPGTKDEDPVDPEMAVTLGKKHGVEYVVIGTILEAESKTGSSDVGGIKLFGQSVGSSLKTVSASITIQGELVSVKSGKVVASERTSGSSSSSALGAGVTTEWGNFNADKDGAGEGPTSKALRDAVEDLVKKIMEKI